MNAAQRKKSRKAGNLVRKGREAQKHIDAAQAEAAAAREESARLRADIARLAEARDSAVASATGKAAAIADEAARSRRDALAAVETASALRVLVQRGDAEIARLREESRLREGRIARMRESCDALRAAAHAETLRCADLERRLAAARETDCTSLRRRLRARSEELHESRTEIQRLRAALRVQSDPLCSEAMS